MFARAHSGTIIGVDAHPIVVESYRGKGLPGMALIGLAKGAAKEALVRVRSALLASELHLGSHRLVVNLLPAELEKDASALDLPLAVSLLASGGHLAPEVLEKKRFFGELSLGGGLVAVRGAVLLADLARRAGDQELIVPYENLAEASVLPGIRVLGAHSLNEVFAYLKGEGSLAQASAPVARAPTSYGCLSEVRGQERAKRALEIAAAGEHNVLLMGPPGSGKTMLARRLAGLLPELTADERIEVTRIHSVVGQTGAPIGLVATRPFRSPHHTASEVALCGGGSRPRPGEITLAHRGVLFLDELPEFARRALESLREPLEEGAIHVARASMSLSFPAQVLLIAAMNPCPCGYYKGDLSGPAEPSQVVNGRVCLCPFDQVQRYRGRVSGPLLDRVDLHVLVDAVPYRDYAKQGSGDSTPRVRARVEEARRAQARRLGSGRTNARMKDAEVREIVQRDPAILRTLEQAIDRHGLSTRAVGRILKVARTIADLAGAAQVTVPHVAEAVDFRVLDRQPALEDYGAA